MIEPDRIARAAAHLGEIRRTRQPVTFPHGLCPADEDDAYAVQAALHQWQRNSGLGDLAGYKIGCTTPVMQDVLQIPGPAFGGVLASRVFRDRAEFPFADYLKPGIECEIAMRLAVDLPPEGAPYTRDAVASAIGACMAAIELVDNRYGDFLSVAAPVMIADDFFQSACILGAEVTDWRNLDLADLEGRTFINGKLGGSGPGAEVLGHPLQAIVWLANRFAGLGRGLKAGEIVMTGSLAPVQWLEAAPLEAVISIDGLGDVSLRLD